MKTLCTISVITGGILILGAAGGCDFGSASLANAILLMLCGFIFCLSGLLLPRYLARRRRALCTRKAVVKNICRKSKRIAAANEITEARKSFVLIKEI